MYKIQTDIPLNYYMIFSLIFTRRCDVYMFLILGLKKIVFRLKIRYDE